LSVVYARRDVDLQLPRRLDVALAAAFRTRLADYLARAAALRAGLAQRKESLLEHDLPAPAAFGTGGDAAFGLASGTAATAARFLARHLNIDAYPAHRVFETQLQVVAQVFAALNTAAPTASAEHIAEEEIAEDLREVREAALERAAAGG
jgi:hypothetical protein